VFTEKQFNEAVETTKQILKDTYVSNIIYIQERMKDGAKEDELKNIEELIIANERMIVYFDQGDEWVKELHEEATKESDNDDGELVRIDEARNS
jgi:hypothetical protein